MERTLRNDKNLENVKEKLRPSRLYIRKMAASIVYNAWIHGILCECESITRVRIVSDCGRICGIQ